MKIHKRVLAFETFHRWTANHPYHTLWYKLDTEKEDLPKGDILLEWSSRPFKGSKLAKSGQEYGFCYYASKESKVHHFAVMQDVREISRMYYRVTELDKEK